MRTKRDIDAAYYAIRLIFRKAIRTSIDVMGGGVVGVNPNFWNLLLNLACIDYEFEWVGVLILLHQLKVDCFFDRREARFA